MNERRAVKNVEREIDRKLDWLRDRLFEFLDAVPIAEREAAAGRFKAEMMVDLQPEGATCIFQLSLTSAELVNEHVKGMLEEARANANRPPAPPGGAR